jgi:hypothetical protein
MERILSATRMHRPLRTCSKMQAAGPHVRAGRCSRLVWRSNVQRNLSRSRCGPGQRIFRTAERREGMSLPRFTFGLFSRCRTFSSIPLHLRLCYARCARPSCYSSIVSAVPRLFLLVVAPARSADSDLPSTCFEHRNCVHYWNSFGRPIFTIPSGAASCGANRARTGPQKKCNRSRRVMDDALDQSAREEESKRERTERERTLLPSNAKLPKPCKVSQSYA